MNEDLKVEQYCICTKCKEEYDPIVLEIGEKNCAVPGCNGYLSFVLTKVWARIK